MIFLLLLLLFDDVTGFGPPGFIPPDTFFAEQWYPSNLPTVMPPWKMPGANIELFRTTAGRKSVTSTTIATVSNSSEVIDDVSSGNLTEIVLEKSEVDESNVVPLKDLESLPADVLKTEGKERTAVSEAELQEKALASVTQLAAPEVEKAVKAEENLIDNVISSNATLIIEDSEELSLLESNVTEPTTTTTTETTTTSTEIILTTSTSTTTKSSETEATTEIRVTIMLPSDDETTTVPSIEKAILVNFEDITKVESVNDTKTIEIQDSSAKEETTVATTISTTEVTTTTASTTSATTTKTIIEKKKKEEPQECSDLLFVIDSSGNVEAQYKKQKELVKSVLEALGKKNRRFGLMTYSGKQRQRFNVPLSQDLSLEDFTHELEEARFIGGVTATGAALRILTSVLKKSARPTDVVIVTDGFSFDRVEEQSRILRESTDVRVYAIGNYFPILRDVLESIAGSPDHVLIGHKAVFRLARLLRCNIPSPLVS